MAAIFGTLPNNQVGNSHRTQEREPSPWEFSTSVNQEVSRLVHVYTSLYVSPTTLYFPLDYVPLARMFRISIFCRPG